MHIENEPPEIADPEHPTGFSHQEILNAFIGLSPESADARPAAREYAQFADRWSDAVNYFASAMERSSASGWEGEAADVAREAVYDYTKQAKELSDVIDVLGKRVISGIASIERMQTELPEGFAKVIPFAVAGMLDPDQSPAEKARQIAVRHEVEYQAREAMQTHYVAPFVSVDEQIPQLPTPKQTAVAPPPVQPPPPPVTPPGGQQEPDGPGLTGGGVPPSEPGRSETDPDPDGPVGPTQPQGWQPEQPTQTAGAASSTAPASAATPEPSGVSSGAAPSSGYSPSTGAIGSGPGGARGFSGPGSTGSGSPGGAIPPSKGTPPGGAGDKPRLATAPISGSNQAGGRAPMAPMMGGMGGARGGKTDEGDKRAPDYLRGPHNFDELIGPLPRTIPDGVLGGEPPTNPDQPTETKAKPQPTQPLTPENLTTRPTKPKER